MSREKIKENKDKPRKVCHDKDLYIATNSSTNDKDQRRKLCRNKRKLYRDRVVE